MYKSKLFQEFIRREIAKDVAKVNYYAICGGLVLFAIIVLSGLFIGYDYIIK